MEEDREEDIHAYYNKKIYLNKERETKVEKIESKQKQKKAPPPAQYPKKKRKERKRGRFG